MPTKIKGTPDFEKNGFKIWVTSHPAKRKGKDRLWITIRQDGKEDWRATVTLSYQKGVDILFQKPKS